MLEDAVFEQELGDVDCRSGQEGPCACAACGVINQNRYPAITNQLLRGEMVVQGNSKVVEILKDGRRVFFGAGRSHTM